MNDPVVEASQWVVSDDAEKWIAKATDENGTSPAFVEMLRRTLTKEQIGEVLDQAELRVGARQKFSSADRMFFTRKGLQQATDEKIANYKATRYFAATSSDATIADLCAGIGGDLIALGQQRRVVGVELDPRSAIFADANGRAMNLNDFSVTTQDATQFPLDQISAWHIDPDRRPQGDRTTQIAFSEPPVGELEKMRALNPNAGIKLAPAAEVTDDWAKEAELEWIGIARECRQLFVTFGAMAQKAGRRVATVLDKEGQVAEQVIGPTDLNAYDSHPVCGCLGEVICEPHSCVIAAGLVSAIADREGLSRINPHIAYLTGNSATASDALSVFDVQEVMPFDIRKVKSALRRLGWQRLEIKKRGIGDEKELRPEFLRKRLRVDGEQSGTLILLPHQGRVTAVLAKRQSDSSN